MLWNLMAGVIILGHARPNKEFNSQSSRLKSDCVGNLMRLSLDKALAVGNQLEVEAIGTQHTVLTPSLAAQCGYSMESDPWGNTRIYTSLMACYVDNKDDTTFNIGLRLKMYSQSPSDVVIHDVAKTCSYTQWASREVLCDRNYMEVSNYIVTPEPQVEAKGQAQEEDSKSNIIPETSAAHGIWKMTFYTPEPVSMVLREAQQAGYSATSTSSRLVVRSPYNTAETYSEDVAGIPMEVFRVTAYYKASNGLSIVNLAAACPTYHVTYTVEPMLEVLWRMDNAQDDTRYKVLFPITTPLMPRPDRMFRVQLGTFLPDVELRNITFSTGVLTVEECLARGFNVQELRFPNETKSFSLQVSFDSDVVLKHNPEALVTEYFLPLNFGFFIMPEDAAFTHTVELRASLQDVLPTATGTCDQNNFYIAVKYGNQGSNFQTMVGARDLTTELADGYNFQENGTHFSLVVPYNAMDTAFELITSNSVRARVDMLLYDPINRWTLADLYLACNFPLTTTCYPNGTMTALAVKVESVPNLIPSWLTLKDQSCKPVFSDDRLAYFSFNVDSCGTTRTYQEHDYPVEKYLREPLYFEVVLESTDSHLELILENCWATLNEDRTSLPSWDIIIDCENRDDSYTTVFHPVVSDTRVMFPLHFKRFAVKMFTFTKDEKVLKEEIYVHCDAVICDTTSQADGAC
uniref:ZP domain-containing protein n=1 Tax=Mola mola TaxID=94237 RepID=A0A3Q4AHM8_MOLML